MKIKQLEYFVTVAETLSFTKSSQIHFISQTAVSKQIRALEDKLEVQLFIRNKRNVALTPVGKIYLTEVKIVLKKLDEIREKIQMVSTGMVGNLKVGYIMGYEKSDFSDLIHLFFKTYPNITLELFRGYSHELNKQIINGCLDVVFTSVNLSMNNNQVEAKFIARYSQKLVIHPTNPLSEKKQIKSEELEGEKLFIYNEREDPETILLRVSANMGVAVVPEYCLKYSNRSQYFTVIDLENLYFVEIYAIWSKKNNNLALPKLIEIL